MRSVRLSVLTIIALAIMASSVKAQQVVAPFAAPPGATVAIQWAGFPPTVGTMTVYAQVGVNIYPIAVTSATSSGYVQWTIPTNFPRSRPLIVVQASYGTFAFTSMYVINMPQ